MADPLFPSASATADAARRAAVATAGLQALFAQRIAVLDGAMGSMIQTFGLDEAAYRGTRFADHSHDLRGDNDLLCLTRPDLIEQIHRDYFAAGADLVETNTFNATRISQADYRLESIVTDLNTAAVAVARRAALAAEAATPGRRCFVAGAIGPLNRTLSLSPDVNRPDFRAVTWDDVVAAYTEQIRALLTAGVDALLVETIFDTLNAKAALFAIESVFDAAGFRVPVMISVTITDASGRTLSGQTIDAFFHSIAHARPFSVGVNCALGGAAMRPYVEELARLAPCYVTCYPNAGLPNAFGGYDETPDQMAAILGEFAASGLVNLVGGCCGSTPDHIRAIAATVRAHAPRQVPPQSPALRLSGLEALTLA
ncbi:homocysteine S-methyltransferase family protein [Horticoccus luteus]|uniref:Methionine synthase n=1 Tax=Horticoccus luteus TaxID=2862869 RepID=A0A8F9TUG2_9BACT|nr:homocysteine S-methyltransferase family protein [Horticoccus luteus]QYM79484.1 homocysteine S-methyltransferase family protein [Horticoccus luteus]